MVEPTAGLNRSDSFIRTRSREGHRHTLRIDPQRIRSLIVPDGRVKGFWAADCEGALLGLAQGGRVPIEVLRYGNEEF